MPLRRIPGVRAIGWPPVLSVGRGVPPAFPLAFLLAFLLGAVAVLLVLALLAVLCTLLFAPATACRVGERLADVR
jgi:hypothetical protein